MKLYEPFKFLTDDECDHIVSCARDNIQVGTTLGRSNVRNNRVSWYKDSTNWSKWIEMFNKIDPVIDWIQTPQVAFYGQGEHYGWHTDTWSKLRTHVRHFTLTCELQSAPGARLEIIDREISLNKGDAVIFKPQDKHRAISPTQGERVSFTIWAMALNLHKS